MMLNQTFGYTSQISLVSFLILVSFDFHSHEFRFEIKLSSLRPSQVSIKQKKYRNKLLSRNLFRQIILE